MNANNVPKIPYNQFVIGLDKLFFGGKIENYQQAQERADTIEAYLEATGYTWDDVLEQIGKDGTGHLGADVREFEN